MSYEADLNRKVHCKIVSSDSPATGTLLISESKIEVELFGYGVLVELNGSHPVYVETQNFNIVSLHSNVSFGSGQRGMGDDGQRLAVRNQRINSNCAVIGGDPWLSSDIIRSVEFEVDGASDLLDHRGRLEKIHEGAIGGYRNLALDLFSIPVTGLTISAAYRPTYSLGWPYVHSMRTVLTIDFVEEKTLSSYLPDVLSVTQFFSAATASPIWPRNIRISRQSLAERHTSTSENFISPHGVQYIWPRVERDNNGVFNSFVRSSDDSQLDGLKDCLRVWLERRSTWKKSNDLLMACFRSRNSLTANRLLVACRWFEEIPHTVSKNVIRREDVEIIALAASRAAAKMGYANLDSRIVGALRRLREETNAERFGRLLLSINGRFGSFLDDDILTDLERTIGFRGKAAHGHFDPSSDDEFNLFAKSVFAMEAFCYLLTLLDLPIAERGKWQLGEISIIRDYLGVYQFEKR